jgi:hypothetical protein
VVVADRIDELIGEMLRREIDDHHAGKQATTLTTNGVEQVRLAEANTAIDEERVICARRELRRGPTGRVGELVRGSDDKGVEGVAWIQPFGRAVRRGRRVATAGASTGVAAASSTTIDTRGWPPMHFCATLCRAGRC